MRHKNTCSNQNVLGPNPNIGWDTCACNEDVRVAVAKIIRHEAVDFETARSIAEDVLSYLAELENL